MKFRWRTGEAFELPVFGMFKGVTRGHKRPDFVEFDSHDLDRLIMDRDKISTRDFLLRLRVALNVGPN